MTFKEFKQMFTDHYNKMIKDTDCLFVVDADKEELWNLYQNSFPAGKNEIFRVRREFDCSCCRHFFRDFGNVVSVKNGVMETIWNFHPNDDTFEPVVCALNEYILSKPIVERFYTKFKTIGVDQNREMLDNEIILWDHFSVDVPSKFRVRSCDNINEVRGAARDTAHVFKRSLDEISLEATDTILELISQNILYRGSEFKDIIEKFRNYKKEYDGITDEAKKELFVWENSATAGQAVGRIRNHSIGTLLLNVSEGMDLDSAVKAYEAIVAPANYKRPKAIFTKKMLEEAKKTIQEMGYMESLPRRHANLDDIKVNNILFSNKDSAKRIAGGDVFAEMESKLSINPRKFSRVEDIPVEKFISDVLPTATEIEAFVENRHAKNFVSLIAPQNPDAKTMFKWNNGFSWAYSGNMADSDIRQNVKNAGGNIHGIIRFSIQWNDGEDHNNCDYDAHAETPDGHIYFGEKKLGNGSLDVDRTFTFPHVPAVENIVWPDGCRLKNGEYHFFVNDYFASGANVGFRAELEVAGTIYNFDYPHSIATGHNVDVATVTVKNGNFEVKTHLASTTSSREIWGVQSQQFVPVSVVMYSPNYWDEQIGNGNRHYFFFLKECVNSEEPNGFYNEFLNEELLKHKRVLEALGGKMAVGSVEDQLSGIGFSSTVRNDLIVKVKGSTERVMRIKF